MYGPPPVAEEKFYRALGPGGYPAFRFVLVCIGLSFRLVRFFVRTSLISQLLLRRARRISGFQVRLGSHRVLLSSRYFRRLVCLQFHGRETGWVSITRPNLSARRDLPETRAGISSVKGRFRRVNRLALCHQHTTMMPALIFVLVLIFRSLLSFFRSLPAPASVNALPVLCNYALLGSKPAFRFVLVRIGLFSFLL